MSHSTPAPTAFFFFLEDFAMASAPAPEPLLPSTGPGRTKSLTWAALCACPGKYHMVSHMVSHMLHIQSLILPNRGRISPLILHISHTCSALEPAFILEFLISAVSIGRSRSRMSMGRSQPRRHWLSAMHVTWGTYVSTKLDNLIAPKHHHHMINQSERF